MRELKPCPFCGGAAGICHVTQLWEPKDSYWGKCNFCHISGSHYPNEAEAIEAWNTRAERTCSIEEDEFGYPECTECGAMQPDDYPVRFCWFCGAKVVE